MFRLFSNVASNVQSWQSLYVSIKILIKVPLNRTQVKLEMARLTHLISHYTEYTLIVRKVLAKSVTRTVHRVLCLREATRLQRTLPSILNIATYVNSFRGNPCISYPSLHLCNWNVSRPNIWTDIGEEPARRSIANGRRVFDDR